MSRSKAAWVSYNHGLHWRHRAQRGERRRVERDLGRRLAAARALRHERDMLAAVVEASPVAVAVLDAAGRVTHANALLHALFGAEPDPGVGAREEALVARMETLEGGSVSADESPFRRARSLDQRVSDQLYVVRAADGRRSLVSIDACPLPRERGAASDVVVTIRDLTASKLAGMGPRGSRGHLGRLLSAARLGAYETPVRGGPIAFNDGYAEMLGYDPGELELPGVQAWIDMIHLDDRPKLEEILLARVAGPPDEYDLEYRMRAKDGTWRWILDRGRVTARDQYGKALHAAGIHEDITARKRLQAEQARLQAQLQQSQKLESLGVIAGGVAHDFNNILSSIVGCAELAALDLSPDHPAFEQLIQVRSGAGRASELCQQLLAYAGRGRFAREPVDLGRLVEEMGQLLAASIGRRVSLTWELPRDLPAVEGDPTQLRQVILNLVVNAAEAVGEAPGVVRVSSRVQTCSEQMLRASYFDDDLPAGDYVVLEVTDTGCGMSEETRRQVFDPFFSTKFAGRGLGLAATMGIIRAHNGTVQVHSRVGEGSRFTVFLPSLREVAVVARPGEIEVELAGSGLVLLIDDEEIVRVVTSHMLQHLGFEVLVAASGRQGLELMRKHAEQVRLVLLDMVMPEMGGEAVLAELRRVQPGLPVIITTGYASTDFAGRVPDGRKLTDVLQKPFGMAGLRDAVRRALADSPP